MVEIVEAIEMIGIPEGMMKEVDLIERWKIQEDMGEGIM